MHICFYCFQTLSKLENMLNYNVVINTFFHCCFDIISWKFNFFITAHILKMNRFESIKIEKIRIVIIVITSWKKKHIFFHNFQTLLKFENMLNYNVVINTFFHCCFDIILWKFNFFIAAHILHLNQKFVVTAHILFRTANRNSCCLKQ